MKPLNNSAFEELCPDIFTLIGEPWIKYTSRAYGWADDTLRMYQEEHNKFMFYMCPDKDGNLANSRRFIYLIKPKTLTEEFQFNKNMNGVVIDGSARNPTVKINLNDPRVIKFKDPFKVNEEKKKAIRRIAHEITKIDNLIQSLL